MQCLKNSKGQNILLAMVKAIQINKDYLGEIDGLIGDGDHGMNMNKGFSIYESRFAGKEMDFAQGFEALGKILLEEIGGSMGPIYGTFFLDMSDGAIGLEKLGIQEIAEILEKGYLGLKEIIEAEPGDKTLIDTLAPAIAELKKASVTGSTLEAGLNEMKIAAKKGMEATKDMEAKYGRSSRLGKRSCGVLDAGAVSCYILLEAMADGILQNIEEE